MSTIRIIPRLDIKGPNSSKESTWRVCVCWQAGALRTVLLRERVRRADLHGRCGEPLWPEQPARHRGEDFAGDLHPSDRRGGIRTIEDIRKILQAGRQVSLNTAAIQQPTLISEAANRFGSSTIVVSIEAKKQPGGVYEATRTTAGSARGQCLRMAAQVQTLGAGEILLTAIDQEGTGEGFDIELTRRVAESVSIPSSPAAVQERRKTSQRSSNRARRCRQPGFPASLYVHSLPLHGGRLLERGECGIPSRPAELHEGTGCLAGPDQRTPCRKRHILPNP